MLSTRPVITGVCIIIFSSASSFCVSFSVLVCVPRMFGDRIGEFVSWFMRSMSKALFLYSYPLLQLVYLLQPLVQLARVVEHRHILLELVAV